MDFEAADTIPGVMVREVVGPEPNEENEEEDGDWGNISCEDMEQW